MTTKAIMGGKIAKMVQNQKQLESLGLDPIKQNQIRNASKTRKQRMSRMSSKEDS